MADAELKENKSLKILIIGPQTMADMLSVTLKKYGYELIVHTEVDNAESFISGLAEADLALVGNICGNVDYEAGPVVSGLQNAFPDMPKLFIVCSGAENLPDEKTLVDSKIEKIFFPFEKEQLLNEIFSRFPVDIATKDLSLDALTKVCISDVEDQTLPFDLFLYLSRNQKLLFYRRQGAEIEKSWREKVSDPRFFLLVKRGDYQKYQENMVGRLKDIAENDELSQAQKAQLMRQETAALVKDLFNKEEFDKDEAQEIVQNFRNIATSFVETMSDEKGKQDQLRVLSAQVLSQQTHSTNVSTYAAMFGMLAGVPDIETLSFAGLLHDIGFYKLPMNLAEKQEWELESEEDREAYRMHPLYAVDVITEKGLPVNALAQEIIAQHHERNDGSGYPHGLKRGEINKLSKICALADVFDEMTSLQEGKGSRTPAAALKRIAGLDGDPPHSVYDEIVHKPIITSLLEDSEPIEERKTKKAA